MATDNATGLDPGTGTGSRRGTAPGPAGNVGGRRGKGPWWHTEVAQGRFTARVDEPLAVFLIGMRVNRAWQVRRWWWVTQAMPRMMEALADAPDLGLLHVENFTRGRTSLSLQYWASIDHLMRFATDRDNPHLAAWRRWNRELRETDDVGIWHETHAVEPGRFEGIYGNMPLFGMAAATERVPVGANRERARQRLAG